MTLILRRLTPADERAFRAAVEEFQDPHFTFASGFDPARPFNEFLNLLNDRESREKTPPGRVPTTFMCGFVGDEIVGRVSVRHGLSEFIKEIGGHVGYGVVPRFRGRGFSKAMLGDALQFCRSLNLKEVLLTCDDDNAPSAKAIEACGGVFERFCADTGDGIKKRRYWIALP